MEALSLVVGAAGVLLVLVGLIGGGFTFSGSVVPKVGGVSRVLCFTFGAAFLLTSLVLALGTGGVSSASASSDGHTTPAPPTPAPATPTPATPAPATPAQAQPDYVVGSIMVPSDRTAYVFARPDTRSPVITELYAGEPVAILCTAQGEAVSSPLTGVTSSLWNGTADGGFVPDVLVDTGTDQAVMPSCAG